MGALLSLFNPPAPTPQGYNVGQANTALNQAQTALAQSQVGLGQQQQLVNALNAQNGIGNQSAVFNQLQGVANGTGPNPAAAQLAQATGANVANQAALAAGQRGASGNVGLMSRQAAQAGSNAQQQAAGQAATLQAQQQLGALNQLGGIAGQQVAQQQAATQGLNQTLQGINQATQGEQGQVLSSLASQNAANAGIAQSQAAQGGQLLGGGLNAVGAAGGALLGLAQGGTVENPKLARVPESDRFAGAAEKRVHYPAHLAHVAHLYHGGEMHDYREGGQVPGDPKVMRDSERNDVVPAKLSPKEIVLPISVTQAKNAPEEAAKFVARELAKRGHGGSGKKDESEFKEALKRAIAGRKAA